MDYDNVDNVWHSIVLVGMVKMITHFPFSVFSFFLFLCINIRTYTHIHLIILFCSSNFAGSFLSNSIYTFKTKQLLVLIDL